MNLTPDLIVYWQKGTITLGATILFTWLVMILLVIGSWQPLIYVSFPDFHRLKSIVNF